MGATIDERVQALETKMDQVPATIEQRFDAVDEAIAEQRRYTEFAFDSVKAELTEVIKAEVRTVNSGLGRLERKLDQFIDRQLPPPRSDPPEQPN